MPSNTWWLVFQPQRERLNGWLLLCEFDCTFFSICCCCWNSNSFFFWSLVLLFHFFCTNYKNFWITFHDVVQNTIDLLSILRELDSLSCVETLGSQSERAPVILAVWIKGEHKGALLRVVRQWTASVNKTLQLLQKPLFEQQIHCSNNRVPLDVFSLRTIREISCNRLSPTLKNKTKLIVTIVRCLAMVEKLKKASSDLNLPMM